MDRLRSLEYFIAAAEEGSFSAAARRMEVSVTAVAKLVNGLERDLGVHLFERSAQGLALTTAGESYLEQCRPSVEALRDLDEQVRASATRPRGTVVVGVQNVVARSMLGPLLPRLHARHPDLQVDLRESTQMVEADAPGVDVYLSLAWPRAPDMIHRSLLQTAFSVCASPAYWARAGMPRHPRDLERHAALLIRTQRGTTMDLWAFTRGDERIEVPVKGWLVCNNAHRDVAIELAEAGQGVARILDWDERERSRPGALVPALRDWACPDAPPLVLSYRPSARRLARVRAFIEFLQDTLGEGRIPMSRGPAWAGTEIVKASSLVGPRGRRR